MAIHPLDRLGFKAIAPPETHPLAPLGFAPATVAIGASTGGRVAVQPTADPAVNQELATEAMPGYTEQLAQVADAVPGATLAATRALKPPARLAAKIVADGQAPETIGDYGAAQIAVDSPQAEEAVVAAVAEHFPVLHRQDRFAEGDPAYHYRSDTLQVQMPNQSSEELQIVPREVLEENPQEHHDYERAREAALAGEDSAPAQARARAANDAAMEKFESRNGEEENWVVRGTIVKGARVRMADGGAARVLYVDPSKRFVRVRTDNGRNVTVRRKDLG